MILVEAVVDLRAYPGEMPWEYARRARHRLDAGHGAATVRARVNRAAISYAALIGPDLPDLLIISAERADIAERFAANLWDHP